MHLVISAVLGLLTGKQFTEWDHDRDSYNMFFLIVAAVATVLNIIYY